jgi:hypothetical protein
MLLRSIGRRRPVRAFIHILCSAQRRVGRETGDVTATSIDICSGSKMPAFSAECYILAPLIYDSSKKTRGSLLDPADSNSGLNDPKHDERSFSEMTTDQLRRAIPRTTSGTTPTHFGQTTPKTTQAPFWETGNLAFQRSFRDEPDNDPQKRPRGRFLKHPRSIWPGRFEKITLRVVSERPFVPLFYEIIIFYHTIL